MNNHEALMREALRQLDYQPESGLFFWTKSRPRVEAGLCKGRLDKDGYIQIKFKGVCFRAHRLAWLAYYGALPASELDHINGNRADNRIENLRLATHLQNQHNRRMSKLNTSGIKGVSPFKGKWIATIYADGKQIYLGAFDNKKDAALARRQAATKLHGEFARHE